MSEAAAADPIPAAPGPSKLRRFLPELVSAVAAVVASVVVAGPALGKGFPLDDAWIHLVYGLSLSEGGGFAYNTGHPGAGATSPAWAVVAALAHLVVGGGPSVYAGLCLKAFGIASHALLAIAAARVARLASAPSSRATVMALVGGCVVATCPWLAFAAVSGMEVSLMAALLLLTLEAAARRSVPLTALFASLAVSTRPEAIVAIPLVALLCARDAALAVAIRRAVAVVVGALVLPAAWMVRNIVATGRPLPSTVYAKALPKQVSTLHTIRTALFTILGDVRPMGVIVGWLLVVVAIVLAARYARRSSRTAETDGDLVAATGALIGLVMVLGLCVHTDFYSPSWFYFRRYLLPPLPLFLVCGLVVVGRLADLAARRLANPTLGAAATVLVGIVAVTSELADFPATRETYAQDVEAIDSVQVALGRSFAEHLPEDAVIWSVDAGATRYFGRRKIVDLVKLNTPELVGDGAVPAAWEPNVVVLIIPYGWRASFDQGDPAVVYEVPANWRTRPNPPDWPGPMPEQVVVRCPPGRAIEVRRRDVLIARSRCAGPSS